MTSVETTTFVLEAPGGISLFVYRWYPDKPERAMVRWVVAHAVTPPSLAVPTR